jgi:hypothetical protein
MVPIAIGIVGIKRLLGLNVNLINLNNRKDQGSDNNQTTTIIINFSNSPLGVRGKTQTQWTQEIY